jgi:hypothetical protein
VRKKSGNCFLHKVSVTPLFSIKITFIIGETIYIALGTEIKQLKIMPLITDIFGFFTVPQKVQE